MQFPTNAVVVQKTVRGEPVTNVFLPAPRWGWTLLQGATVNTYEHPDGAYLWSVFLGADPTQEVNAWFAGSYTSFDSAVRRLAETGCVVATA